MRFRSGASCCARALRVAAVGPRLEVGGAVAHRRRRAAEARALQQRAVGEDERRHPLDERWRAWQYTRVVPALGLEADGRAVAHGERA